MESLVNQPAYYGYCAAAGGLLFPTAGPPQSNAACANQKETFLRHQSIDIYNLRPRNVEVLSTKESVGNTNADVLHTGPGLAAEVERTPSNLKRKVMNRSRTTYNKRLLVNARERERMKTLNKGFENLRNALPCYIADGHISKITTLRLAINYIKTLTEVLNDTDIKQTFPVTSGLVQALNNDQLVNVYHGETMRKCDNISSTVLPEKAGFTGSTRNAGRQDFNQSAVLSPEVPMNCATNGENPAAVNCYVTSS